MPCEKTRPTYKKKSEAKRHGAISYAGKYRVRKTKSGYRAYPR